MSCRHRFAANPGAASYYSRTWLMNTTDEVKFVCMDRHIDSSTRHEEVVFARNKRYETVANLIR